MSKCHAGVEREREREDVCPMGGKLVVAEVKYRCNAIFYFFIFFFIYR